MSLNNNTNFLKGKLSKTLLFRILIISGIFSAISIFIQLISEYEYEKTRLDISTKEIALSYKDLLNSHIFELHDPALQKTLDSIVNFESISRATVKTRINGIDNSVKMESGEHPKNSTVMGFGLIISDGYNNWGNPILLELVTDYSVAEQKVLDKLFIIALSQGIKTFVVSLLILLFIHQLVIRHILQISNWLHSYDPKSSFIPLNINSIDNKKNELDDLKVSVNKMGMQIHQYTHSLEKLVIQRTTELNKRTKELEYTQKELHKILWEKEQKLLNVSEAINDWLWDIDPFGNVVSISDEFALLIGFSNKKDEPQQLIQILPFVKDNSVKDIIEKLIIEKSSIEAINCCLLSAKNEHVWITLTAKPYFTKSREFLGYHGSATNITQHKHLEKLAYIDSLTGIANRAAFFHHVEKELVRSRRLSYDVGVMMLDLDFFKQINDSYGHDAGDDVLKKVAKSLESCLREQDCIGRIGGEEFALITPGADKHGLSKLANRLREVINLLEFPFIEDGKSVTISIGYTTVKNNETFKVALNRADKHLYAAKSNGRNCSITDKQFIQNIPS